MIVPEKLQEADYTKGCLLDYNFFKIYYKVIAIDLSKRKALDPDAKECKKLILQEI